MGNSQQQVFSIAAQPFICWESSSHPGLRPASPLRRRCPPNLSVKQAQLRSTKCPCFGILPAAQVSEAVLATTLGLTTEAPRFHAETQRRGVPLYVIVLLALAIHGPLLFMQVSGQFIRYQFPHLLCLALCPALVESLESKVVCRFLPDHLSPSGTPVDGSDFPRHRPQYGVCRGAVAWCFAAGSRYLPLCAAVRGRPRRQLRRDCLHLPGSPVVFAVRSRTALNHGFSGADVQRLALLLCLVSARPR